MSRGGGEGLECAGGGGGGGAGTDTEAGVEEGGQEGVVVEWSTSCTSRGQRHLRQLLQSAEVAV